MRMPIILALACLLTLGACGSSNSEADDIKKLLAESVTSKDPRSCDAGSDAFIAQTSFGSSSVAKYNAEFCRQNIARLAPDSADVSRVKVDGDMAEAQFTLTGGGQVYDEATMQLRKRDGRWRAERITAMTLDRTAFDTQLVEGSTTGADAVSMKMARCFVRTLKPVDDAEIARKMIKADAGIMFEPILRCALAPELRKSASRREADCVIRALRRRSPTRVVQLLNAEGKAAQAQLDALFKSAYAGC
jgi:hypothetical protein